MKTKTLFTIAILIIVIGAAGCKKTEGCKDRDSVNYNPDAEVDDGSCKFEGSIIFWYNQSTANFLVNDGATALTYYVNGTIVGSSAAAVYYPSAPSCGQNGSITVKKDLGGEKSKSYNYSIKDQTGFEYYNGSITFTANTCTSYQLQ